jgi:hypothetical protein
MPWQIWQVSTPLLVCDPMWAVASSESWQLPQASVQTWVGVPLASG